MTVSFYKECTQNREKRDGSFEHVTKTMCALQMCSKCEPVDDMSVDCE